MNTFETSNGVGVRLNTDHDLYLRGNGADPDDWEFAFNSAGVLALREFFQHERDEALGRWRWPDNPEYVVYAGRRPILVLNELTGDTLRAHREDGFSDSGHGTIYNAAGAYFEAHPERKPWHDATEGEVWIVTPSKALTGGEPVEYPAIFQAGCFRDHGGSWEARDLTAARRIWPESD